MARRTRAVKARNPHPILRQSFYAFRPPLQNTAGQLFVAHRWSNVAAAGTGHVKARHSVMLTTVVARVLTVPVNLPSSADAKTRFEVYARQMENFEVDVDTARDRFAELTGTARFWRCSTCNELLALAAAWCQKCGAPALGHRTTSQEHAALYVGADPER